MFEFVYDDGRRRTPTDDGRTDGRRLDGYTISSPCEPNGSGELIMGNKRVTAYQIAIPLDFKVAINSSIGDMSRDKGGLSNTRILFAARKLTVRRTV